MLLLYDGPHPVGATSRTPVVRGDWDEDWWQTLNKLGVVGERERQQYRAQRMGMAFADLDRVVVDRAALDSMPAELARESRALPVKRDGRTLWVAFAEPDSAAERRIAEATGLRVVPVLCTRNALDDALDRLLS